MFDHLLIKGDLNWGGVIWILRAQSDVKEMKRLQK